MDSVHLFIFEFSSYFDRSTRREMIHKLMLDLFAGVLIEHDVPFDVHLGVDLSTDY